MPDSLYDRDYYAWTREQAMRLREAGQHGHNSAIDWERVAEEIEDMGDVKWDEIENRLGLLLTHLLKLIYCPELRERNARQWWLTIREQRKMIPKRLKRSPSLRPLLTSEFLTVYGEAREDAGAEAECSPDRFPAEPPFTFEQVMEMNFPEEFLPDHLRR